MTFVLFHVKMLAKDASMHMRPLSACSGSAIKEKSCTYWIHAIRDRSLITGRGATKWKRGEGGPVKSCPYKKGGRRGLSHAEERQKKDLG